jgi:plastocyanin
MKKYMTVALILFLILISTHATAGSAANKVVIKLANFKFEPARVTIAAGTTVVWQNDQGRHTIEADKGEFKSPVLTAGQTYEFTFDKPGTYGYHCGFHGEAGGKDMAGTIVVTKRK